jgi:hypothetical protein
MAFRKPITTLGGLLFWNNIKQSEYFIMQEHKTGIWPYKYRIIMRENRMEIANSNDPEEIRRDWEYLETHTVPQLDQAIDVWKRADETMRQLSNIDLNKMLDIVIKTLPSLL